MSLNQVHPIGYVAILAQWVGADGAVGSPWSLARLGRGSAHPSWRPWRRSPSAATPRRRLMCVVAIPASSGGAQRKSGSCGCGRRRLAASLTARLAEPSRV
jgi:hypothetical protein